MFQPCLYLTKLVKDTGTSDEVFVSCDAGTTWISLQDMVTVSSLIYRTLIWGKNLFCLTKSNELKNKFERRHFKRENLDMKEYYIG